MKDHELYILEETKKYLSQLGRCDLVYITAELAPFSNQQRPDLVFFPKEVSQYAFFVEYKLEPLNGFSQSYWDSFEEKKAFVDGSSEIKLFQAFATNAKINIDARTQLEKMDIKVFDEIVNAEQLQSSIKEWYEAVKD
jgi:hypothetical protein